MDSKGSNSHKQLILSAENEATNLVLKGMGDPQYYAFSLLCTQDCETCP